MIRPDFIFSYWIFVWFLLYEIHIIKFNPKFAIILGFIENSILLFFMIQYSTLKHILFFLIFNFFIKVLPFYFIWKTKFHKKDVVFTLFLFIIYLLWIKMNNVDDVVDSIIHNREETPGIALLDKIYSKMQATFSNKRPFQF